MTRLNAVSMWKLTCRKISMRHVFTKKGLEDYTYWGKVNKKNRDKIKDLIENIKATPFTGIGMPEPLGGNWRGYWSRRINHEHRLVYKIEGKGENQKIVIVQARYHY